MQSHLKIKGVNTLKFSESIQDCRSRMQPAFTLSDRCNIPIGNSGVGSVVSHSLKSGWGLLIRSKTFSNSRSHFTKRWQFCNINHCPRVNAVSSNCRASYGNTKHSNNITGNLATRNRTYRLYDAAFCKWANKRKQKHIMLPFLVLVPWPKTSICYHQTLIFQPTSRDHWQDRNLDSGWIWWGSMEWTARRLLYNNKRHLH